MAQPKSHQTRVLKPGDRVVLDIAGGRREGVVIEDRGPLGVDGEQIVAIRFGDGSHERPESVSEARADDLELI